MKQTENEKFWGPSFCPEYYRDHHEKQHHTRWEAYKLASTTDKQWYFNEKIKHKETIPHHFSTAHFYQIFEINTALIENVVGDMFFHSEDDIASRAQAMKLFTFCESHYNITIKNPLQFQLVVTYPASGLSFRQVESVFNKTKKLTANAQLGTISDTTVANYAGLVCALNFQKLADILNNPSVWAFSLANDSSTHYGNSYFDNWIRFHHHGILYNLHVIAIPIFYWHTGKNMYKLISHFLDIICSEWH